MNKLSPIVSCKMNVIRRAAVQQVSKCISVVFMLHNCVRLGLGNYLPINCVVCLQLLGQRFGADRCQHFPIVNIALQFCPTNVHQGRTLTTKQSIEAKAFSTGGTFAASAKSYESTPSLAYRLRNFFGLIPLERHVMLKSHSVFWERQF